jgi:hypothetical protein
MVRDANHGIERIQKPAYKAKEKDRDRRGDGIADLNCTDRERDGQ